MLSNNLLLLLSGVCALSSATVLPREDQPVNITLGATGGDDIVTVYTANNANSIGESKAEIGKELFGNIIEYELEATIKAIINIIKLPAKERAFNHQMPGKIVQHFWDKGYNVAGFCSGNMEVPCSNCMWKYVEVGGEQGDRYACGILGLLPPGHFTHVGATGWVNWGYAWKDKVTECVRSYPSPRKTMVTCHDTRVKAAENTDALAANLAEVTPGDVIVSGGDDGDDGDDGNAAN